MTTFHSLIPNLLVPIKVDGHVRYLKFVPKGRPYKYGYLYLGDEKEIAALKNHPDFGSIITIAHEDNTPQVEQEVKEYAKVYPDVTKTQEAKQILKDEYDYPIETITSKAAAKAAAEELNISFPNL